MDLLYMLTLWSCVCVGGGGFGSNDFVIKAQSFPMDGNNRTDINSGVSHLRSDLVVSLMLYMVVVQYLRHWYCTTSPSRQLQPY